MSGNIQTIIQNLQDAGCDAHIIEEFLALGLEFSTS